MADNKCKKKLGKKDRPTAEARTRKNKARRIKAEELRQNACARVRALNPGDTDISRLVRQDA